MLRNKESSHILLEQGINFVACLPIKIYMNDIKWR